MPLWDEYRYLPKPPEATPDNQICWHIWPRLLRQPCCDGIFFQISGRCPKAWIRSHRCILPLRNGSKEILSRIPQKTSTWHIGEDGISDAWGISTQNVPQITYLVFYHLLLLACPFPFVGVWIKITSAKDSGPNLQDSTVPVTIAFGLVGLFWCWWQIIIPRTEVRSPYFY